MFEPENPWASAGRTKRRPFDNWPREALVGLGGMVAVAAAVLVFTIASIAGEKDDRTPEEIAREEALQASIALEAAIFENYDSSLARTRCEALVQARTTRPSTFRAGWSYGERRHPNEGAVSLTNTFKSRNAFNAEMEGSYSCRVDAATNAVVGLEAKTPDGRIIIVQGHP